MQHKNCYEGEKDVVNWQGFHVNDEEDFKEYLQSRVRNRFDAKQYEDDFQDDLEYAEMSGMDTGNLQDYIDSYDTPKDYKPWKIGEALSECILSDWENAILPWNRNRDELLPKVSLPGNDIVGFIYLDGGVRFMFGETKTSGDTTNTPPTVMSDMHNQLHRHIDQEERRKVHSKVLRYLHARTKDTEYRSLFLEALKYHAKDKGAFILVGVLLRDTEPNEKDVRPHSEQLAEDAEHPTRVRMRTHYFPIDISEWPNAMRDEA
jgi:hypothetical protein